MLSLVHTPAAAKKQVQQVSHPTSQTPHWHIKPGRCDYCSSATNLHAGSFAASLADGRTQAPPCTHDLDVTASTTTPLLLPIGSLDELSFTVESSVTSVCSACPS